MGALAARLVPWRQPIISTGDHAMKLERVFEMEKETKNTVRYQEEQVEGQPPVIGTIYVQKWALKGIPNKVKVTLEMEGK
jgi:hypothetical protein